MTLAVWLCALLTLLVAITMTVPDPVLLSLHQPAFLLLSAVIAYGIPDRARTIVLGVCAPATAVAFATLLL